MITIRSKKMFKSEDRFTDADRLFTFTTSRLKISLTIVQFGKVIQNDNLTALPHSSILIRLVPFESSLTYLISVVEFLHGIVIFCKKAVKFSKNNKIQYFA